MRRLAPPSKNPLTVPLAIIGLFVVAGSSFWLGRWSAQGELDAAEAPAALEEAAAAEAPEAIPDLQAPPEVAPTEVVAAPAAPTAPPQAAPPREPTRRTDGLRDLSVTIRGSVVRTLVQALGRDVGDPLAQVAGRLLVWWVDPTRDLRKGDDLHLVYELPEGSEPVIHALSFTSQKLGQTFQAFRFQAPGAPFPRYYDKEGKEVELRLERSPMAEYEQITSLLRDGRGHAGVDFKAPSGLPVVSPFAGRVTRTNFNTRINGNCVEMEDGQGRRILYLHLAELAPEMKAGAAVRRGQKVGLSGNTGRSTAPHLHYQIMSKAGRVLDPFKVHPTFRLSLEPAHAKAFRQAVESYERRLRLVAEAN